MFHFESIGVVNIIGKSEKKTMKKYYIGYSDLLYRHAGSKAKLDIGELLEEQGFSLIGLPRTSRSTNHVIGFLLSGLIGLRRILKLVLCMPSNSIIVINHPFDFASMNFAFHRFVKHNKVILINHDLGFLRAITVEELTNEPAEKYKELYNLACGLIVPVPTIPVLNEIGVSSQLISPLEVFPYLLRISQIDRKSFSKTVAFTGNLEKSEFIKDWLMESRSYFIELIGIWNKPIDVGTNAAYRGSYEPDIVPFKIESSFGLVWDGDSTKTCGGVYGNYLRYNCPHKLSLYLAIGIPVFIWKEAGMAEFVEKNGLGFAIEKLSDIDEILADMNDDKYQQLQSNIEPIQRKIADGSYFKEALNDIIANIK